MVVGVIGSRGFIGGGLLEAVQGMGIPVVEITPNFERKHDQRVFSPAEVLSGAIFSEAELDTVIIAARGPAALHPQFGTLALIKSLEMRVESIINFSTYAQHQTVPKSSTLWNYLEHKKRVSDYLMSSKAKNVLDLSLYTVSGLRDSPKSFMSQLIHAAKAGSPLTMTGGEQLVSYTSSLDLERLIVSILMRNGGLISGQYCFWPEPPTTLNAVVQEVSRAASRKFDIVDGVIPYKGHELFSYDPTNFPPQIDTNYCWTPLSDIIRDLLYRSR
jgi:nucleoside-diphosphate-sugar epimerase